jgi:hypothetical protein
VLCKKMKDNLIFYTILLFYQIDSYFVNMKVLIFLCMRLYLWAVSLFIVYIFENFIFFFNIRLFFLKIHLFNNVISQAKKTFFSIKRESKPL